MFGWTGTGIVSTRLGIECWRLLSCIATFSYLCQLSSWWWLLKSPSNSIIFCCISCIYYCKLHIICFFQTASMCILKLKLLGNFYCIDIVLLYNLMFTDITCTSVLLCQLSSLWNAVMDWYWNHYHAWLCSHLSVCIICIFCNYCCKHAEIL